MYSVSVRNKLESLMDESQEKNMQLVYDSLSDAIDKANSEILPKITKEPKRPWMTEAILNLIVRDVDPFRVAIQETICTWV